jgi:Uroporphyrinogen decarboxylase (URO-D)
MKEKILIHPRDTMNAEERLRAVIGLQVPDRVPVSPLIYYFNATYNGLTSVELYDARKYYRGIERILSDLGPQDIYYHINIFYPEVFSLIWPMKVLEPGRQLPPDVIRQFLEEECMFEDDYQWLLECGEKYPWFSYWMFIMRLVPRIWENVPGGWRTYGFMMPRIAGTLALKMVEYKRLERKGLAMLHATGVEAVFDIFSMARGVLNFARDIRRYPREIKEAADVLTPSLVLYFKAVCLSTGIKRVMLALHRSSNDFISPRTFRDLSLPAVKDIVERLAADGISTVLHCDGNFDLNFEALRELPAGRVIVQLDGTSDIFMAKEVIGDRICLMGDVPAHLLTLGSPAEVDEYCHRLIEEVGRGGGFILSAGCEVPPNARPENIKAMLDAVVKYGYYDA